MNDLITVVVPIYNVEPYLHKCVDSIINQTYKNLEIILVDDGSTDSCGKICDSYAKKDNRVRVIHKQNGGLSDARNAGIEILTGKYVTFIDSDDWVEATYVEQLYRLLIEKNADLSACDFYCIDSDSNIYNSPATNGEVFVWNREQAISKLLVRNKMSTSACGKLYKSKYFVEKGIRYPKGKLYEDIPVTYRIVLESDKIVFGNYALYNYYLRQHSISNMKFSPQKMQAIENLESVLPQVLQQFPQFKGLCTVALFCVNFNTFLSISDKKQNMEYERKVIKAIKQYRNGVIFSKYATVNWRIKALMTYMGLSLVKWMFSKRIVKGRK